MRKLIIPDDALAVLTEIAPDNMVRNIAQELLHWRQGILTRTKLGEVVIEEQLCVARGCNNLARWADEGSKTPDMCSLHDMESGRKGHRP